MERKSYTGLDLARDAYAKWPVGPSRKGKGKVTEPVRLIGGVAFGTHTRPASTGNKAR
jgi:hypothetical protein